MKFTKSTLKITVCALTMGLVCSAHAITRPIIEPYTLPAKYIGTPHEISGHIDVNSNCFDWGPAGSLDHVTVRLRNKYLIYDGDGFRMPVPGSTLKLASGHVLKSRIITQTDIDREGGSFSLEFRELIAEGRVPFLGNVLYSHSGITSEVAVYNFRTIEVVPKGLNGIAGWLYPAQLIAFYGDETYKDVGELAMSCMLIGG